jgi:hypothetical protein
VDSNTFAQLFLKVDVDSNTFAQLFLKVDVDSNTFAQLFLKVDVEPKHCRVFKKYGNFSTYYI